MAKDPAFLFYPGDWLGGTMTFNRPNKGAYIDLLICQFNNGPLTIEDIRTVLSNDFESMWESKLKSKFKIDEEGRFFNKKLLEEMIKRKGWCKSRNNNKEGNNQYSGSEKRSYDLQNLGHMENVNEDEDLTKQKIKFSEFVLMTQGQHDQLAQKLGITVLKTYIERLNNYIGSKGKKYKSHYHTILSWADKDGVSKAGPAKRSEQDETLRKMKQWEKEKQIG